MSSSFDSIYEKQSSSLEHGGAGHAHEAKIDPVRRVSPVVAHELNNLLTIIQGYSEQLLRKHGSDPKMEKPLKRIIEASSRAADIVRAATPPATTVPPPKEIGQPSGEQTVV